MTSASRQRKFRAGSLIIVTAFMTTLLWQNCTSQFRADPVAGVAESASLSATGDDGQVSQDFSTLPDGTSRHLTTADPHPVLKDLQPVLASRATGCVTCHAKIQGNVITDFGHGDSYYFNGSLAGTNGPWYGDYNDGMNWAWGTVELKSGSQVLVPRNATLPASLQGMTGGSRLSDYIKWVLRQNQSMESRSAQVRDMSKVFIGTPSADRLRAVGGLSGSTRMKFHPAGIDSAPFTGVAQAPGKSYFTNGTDPIVCDGDLVIDDVLWLNKPVIATYHGCRIYSTKSVFVTGPVTYAAVDSQSYNLQIMSARAIMLGIGRSCGKGDQYSDSYETRLNSSHINPQSFVLRSSQNTNQILADMRADADVIGSQMMDATCGPGGRNVGFLHMVLNAPVIQSRYSGVFNGSLIGEIVFTPLGGNGSMAYDPVFKTLPVFPLVKPEEFLEVIP